MSPPPQLFPLTGNSDTITHFVGMQVDLPLTVAEREALLAHCGGSFATPTAAPDLPLSAASSSSAVGGAGAGAGAAASVGRVQGELLFRHHRQQYQLRQERVSDAQLQQAYYLLSAIAPGSSAMAGAGPGAGAAMVAGPMAAGPPALSSSSSSSSSSSYGAT